MRLADFGFLRGRAVGWIEVCKWFGFAGMVADHGHRAGLWVSGPWWYAAGRLAFPLFVFAFSYGLVRCSADARQLRWKKLILMGIVAQVAFPLVFGTPWWALNILFVFVAGWIVWCWACRGTILDWFAVFALLAVTHPLFAPASYGMFGPIGVACALSAWSGRLEWRVLFGGLACGLLVFLVAPLSWQMVCLLVGLGSAVIYVRLAAVRPPRTQFGLWYVVHLLGIVLVKCFVTKDGVNTIMQCSAADVGASSAWLFGMPMLLFLAGLVLWSCYGKARWLPRILVWRAAVRARFFNL